MSAAAGLCPWCDLPTMGLPLIDVRDAEGEPARACRDCVADDPDLAVDPDDARDAQAWVRDLWDPRPRSPHDVDMRRLWLVKRVEARRRGAQIGADHVDALADAIGALLAVLAVQRDRGHASVTSRAVMDALHRGLA